MHIVNKCILYAALLVYSSLHSPTSMSMAGMCVCVAYVAHCLFHTLAMQLCCISTLQEMYFDAFTLIQIHTQIEEWFVFPYYLNSRCRFKCVFVFFFHLLHHIRKGDGKRTWKKKKSPERKCEQMNPIVNRISLLRSCTQYSGELPRGQTIGIHTVSVHSMHYSCLIVRLNPIIQRKSQRRKENEKNIGNK